VQLTKSLTDATGMSEQEAVELWFHMPNSPFRTLVEYELEKRKMQETAALAVPGLSLEDYRKQQGVVEGLQVAIGILNRKPSTKSKT
jgi:hypothetical protein